MKTISIILLGFFLSQVGFANTFFIPNYHKGRRQMTNFTATAWSQRNEAAFLYSNTQSEEKKSSIKTEDYNATDFGGLVFYRNPNMPMSIEGQFLKQTTETDDLENSENYEGNNQLIAASLGYEIVPQNMALSLFLNKNTFDNENTTLNQTSTFNLDITSVGWGYRLPSQIYFGLGVMNSRLEIENFSNDTTNTYVFGFGQVIGNEKNPDYAYEVGLSYASEDGNTDTSLTLRGLHNLSEQTQLVAELTFDQGEDENGNSIMLGADYEISHFFISPQVSYETTKFDNSIQDSESSTSYAVELGYRTAKWECSFEYENTTENAEFEVATNDTEDIASDLKFRVSYFF